MKTSFRSALLLSLAAISQFVCKPTPEEVLTDGASRESGRHAPKVLGYNYTDQDINSFDVMGAGGAMLGVSSETSGGGGAVCCVIWRDGTPLPAKVKVKWAFDACEYLSEPDPLYGNRIESMKTYFKEEEVIWAGPVPENPTLFEVHFYPQKHVEVSIASGISNPRLRLSGDRAKDFRRCTPEELTS